MLAWGGAVIGVVRALAIFALLALIPIPARWAMGPIGSIGRRFDVMASGFVTGQVFLLRGVSYRCSAVVNTVMICDQV